MEASRAVSGRNFQQPLEPISVRLGRAESREILKKPPIVVTEARTIRMVYPLYHVPESPSRIFEKRLVAGCRSRPRFEIPVTSVHACQPLTR